MQLYDLTFFLFAAITVVSAFVVVFARNMLYAAFALLFTFFGVAGLYVLLQADFLAVTQVLVYVGGILVLLLFGVMLTNRVISVDIKTKSMQTFPALFLVSVLAGVLGGLSYTVWKGVPASASTATGTTAVAIGDLLMTTYVLPFEVASVVLLVALIGAAMTARRTRNG
jgi:NADH-quinone oxidoreductase subunit J